MLMQVACTKKRIDVGVKRQVHAMEAQGRSSD